MNATYTIEDPNDDFDDELSMHAERSRKIRAALTLIIEESFDAINTNETLSNIENSISDLVNRHIDRNLSVDYQSALFLRAGNDTRLILQFRGTVGNLSMPIYNKIRYILLGNDEKTIKSTNNRGGNWATARVAT